MIMIWPEIRTARLGVSCCSWNEILCCAVSSPLAGREVSLISFSQVQRQTLLSVHSPVAKPSAERLDGRTVLCVWNIWEPSSPRKVLVYESEVRSSLRLQPFYFKESGLRSLLKGTEAVPRRAIRTRSPAVAARARLRPAEC